MTPEKIKTAIDNSVLCWLATSVDGIPNVSPKEIFINNEKGQILIANIASPQSVKNIKVNPNVCVSFIDVFVQKGFKIKGTARIIEKSNDQYPEFSQPLIDLVGGRFSIASVILVDIENIRPILAPSYQFFPAETTEQQQIQAAMKTYGVKQ